jgi:hypothetical protein
MHGPNCLGTGHGRPEGGRRVLAFPLAGQGRPKIVRFWAFLRKICSNFFCCFLVKKVCSCPPPWKFLSSFLRTPMVEAYVALSWYRVFQTF